MKHILHYITRYVKNTFADEFKIYPHHAKIKCRNSHLKPGQVIWCSLICMFGTVQEREEDLKPYRSTDYLVLFEDGSLKIADDKWLWTDNDIYHYNQEYPILRDHELTDDPKIEFRQCTDKPDCAEVTVKFQLGEKTYIVGHIVKINTRPNETLCAFVLSEPHFLTKSSLETIKRYLTSMNKRIKGGRYDGSITG